MVRFVIVHCGKHYRIEMTTRAGDRRLIGRYSTIEEAIERRRVLQQKADAIEFRRVAAPGEL
jgi:hypothetical protein